MIVKSVSAGSEESADNIERHCRNPDVEIVAIINRLVITIMADC